MSCASMSKMTLLVKRPIVILQIRCLHPFAPGEPRGPQVKTPIPGPKSQKIKDNLRKIFYASKTRLISDLHKSTGCYLADADGNLLLDLFPQGGTLPLGYNHPSLLKVMKDKKNMKIMINRPSLGKYPGSYWYDKLHGVMIANAPKKMQHVTSMMCGACSVENALKIMFMAYGKRSRGNNDNFSKEAQNSAVINQPPGSPNYTVLSYKNSNYTALTTGASILSNYNHIEKIGLGKDWPIAPIPKYQYPLEKYKDSNINADVKALTETEDLIKKYRDKKLPVVGIIVQTIQLKHHHMFSSEFLRDLQGLAKKHHILFCIDECTTCCGLSGKLWDVDNLGLHEAPDILTFSGMMQFGGYYRKNQIYSMPFRIFNTWMGEPGRILITEAILKEIKEKNLLDNAQAVGCYLLDELTKLQNEFSSDIAYVSGRGLLIGIVFRSADNAEDIASKLLKKGVVCGIIDDTICLRPAIILGKHHCDFFLDILRKCLTED